MHYTPRRGVQLQPSDTYEGSQKLKVGFAIPTPCNQLLHNFGYGPQASTCTQNFDCLSPAANHQMQRRIQGRPGPPIFGKVNFIFYIVYNV